MKEVALLVFTESTQREDAFKSRVSYLEDELRNFNSKIGNYVKLVRIKPDYIRCKTDLRRAVANMQGLQDVCCCILYTGTFVNASDVAMAARLITVPCMLIGNQNSNTVSKIGFLAAAGAIAQAGLKVKRIDGDINDEKVRDSIIAFVRAADAANKLLGETYGLIGGRSLGISTNISDPAQWLRLFGVDIEHVDQLEIVTRAGLVPSSRVELYKKWVMEKFGKVILTKGRFEDIQLEKMIRSYIALKEIAEEYSLDFAGVKCQSEMSNGYIIMCFALSLMNETFDAEGKKKTIPTSCEGDSDGALTMEILKHISDGLPVTLQDVFKFEGDRALVLANCGAGAPFYSAYSDNPDDNLKNVYLQPHGFGAAGGASLQFNYAPGINTLARLTRDDLQYKMLITRGTVLKKTRDDIKNYSWFRPTSIMELEVPGEVLASHLDSNHLLTVYGDYTRELVEFCTIKGIPYDLMVD